MNSQLQLLEFQEYLKSCKKIIALVGAGLSVSSGLPTYRGTSSAGAPLWKNFNMIDLATPDSFYIDPGLVWQFYHYRRYKALNASPNDGHYTLSKLSKLSNVNFLTITQNVDGLNLRSGHKKSKLIEIHGSLFGTKCTNFTCNFKENENFKMPMTEALDTPEDDDRVRAIDEKDLPRCPVCQGLLRPDVLWFGESLSLNKMNKIDNFIEAKDGVDLILVIGTSGTVYPAISYVDRVVLKGGKVAIFNTEIEDDILNGKRKNYWGFRGDAAETLPTVLKPLLEENGVVKDDKKGAI
ncbi:unnamed protein product [Candida verbasci]|uniref:Deacetylase sirtuin-type domain-containing protein n=1 Tax=Candida verbasci TaxID=1227364 RepID=A0A9W4XM77_9ASCO|nr:unnamed protein product [Candida verbasci]